MLTNCRTVRGAHRARWTFARSAPRHCATGRTSEVRRASINGRSACRYSRRKVSPERYAVVSCHVERPLDDAVWTRFAALQEARPAGFAIAALVRPADPRSARTSWDGSSGRRKRRRVGRSGTTRTGRRPIMPVRWATRREPAVRRRDGALRGARASPDSLLRRWLVHRRRGGGGLRRARLRRLHASSPPPAVPAGRRALGDAHDAGRCRAPLGTDARCDSNDALAGRSRPLAGSP